MCGRYTLSSPADLLVDLFELSTAPGLAPRYNIAPTQEAPVVRIDPTDSRRKIVLMRWGLVPFWAKDPDIGNRMINARAETVAEKPSFRSSFKRRRCLVIADGFYEWQKTGGPKQPFYFRMADQQPFAMAGLWDRWEKSDSATLETYTIITTEPNDLVRPVHNRMPVILTAEQLALWLAPEIDDKKRLTRLLRPFSPDPMQRYAISTYVNDPSNEGDRCIEPLPRTR
jgi:putative SOS response-associated peptidase YedK